MILRVLRGFKTFIFLDFLGFFTYYLPMNAVAKSLNGIRAWTDAQRAEQAVKLHARKIWTKSTGPTSAESKLKSSQNARGQSYEERQELRLICRYLRTQKSYIALLKFYSKQGDRVSPHIQNHMELHLDFFENELIAIEREMFGGLRFSEIAGLDNRNIIPFPTPPPPYREK